jgi:hypothetical protein
MALSSAPVPGASAQLVTDQLRDIDQRANSEQGRNFTPQGPLSSPGVFGAGGVLASARRR